MSELFSYRRKGIVEWFKENRMAVLYTLIFHLLVLIILIFAKVEKLKQIRELGVLISFEEKTIEQILEEEQIEVPAEFLEMINRRRELASNRAVNIGVDDPFNREISTDEYLNQLLQELEEGRDEEIIQDRERWKEILESGGYLEPSPEPDEEEPPYTGPTTITFRFLDAPLKREKTYLMVPVYKCQGAGLVRVEAVVARDGSVLEADVKGFPEGEDAQCFARAALEAALASRFRVEPRAPEKQRVEITYSFIAQ